MDISEQLQWSPGPRVEHADDQAVGQMFMEQYFLHKDKKMMEPDARSPRRRDCHARRPAKAALVVVRCAVHGAARLR